MAKAGGKRGILSAAVGRVPRWVWVAGGLLLAVLLPVAEGADMVDTVWIRLGVRALTYAMLALGLNLVMGETGMLNLGYVAFFAIGSYTTAILSAPYVGIFAPWWVVVPLSVLLAMAAGFAIGLPTLRLRGDYLAIVTLAFGEIVRTIFLNVKEITNGPGGLPNIQQPSVFGFTFDPIAHPQQYYYLVLALLVLVTILLTNLKNSRAGRAWNALREDEIAARHAGVDATRMKVTAVVISAGIAGLAGSVFAYYQVFINPNYFLFMQSVVVVCMVVLGGMGSIPGAVVGAIALDTTPEFIRQAFSNWLPDLLGPSFMASWPPSVQTFFTEFDRYRMLLFGIVIVIVVIFRPEGLLPDTLWRREAHEEDPREQEKTNQTLFDVDEGRQDLEA